MSGRPHRHPLHDRDRQAILLTGLADDFGLMKSTGTLPANVTSPTGTCSTNVPVDQDSSARTQGAMTAIFPRTAVAQSQSLRNLPVSDHEHG